MRSYSTWLDSQSNDDESRIERPCSMGLRLLRCSTARKPDVTSAGADRRRDDPILAGKPAGVPESRLVEIQLDQNAGVEVRERRRPSAFVPLLAYCV